jgi:hypothetical protein
MSVLDTVYTWITGFAIWLCKFWAALTAGVAFRCDAWAGKTAFGGEGAGEEAVTKAIES